MKREDLETAGYVKQIYNGNTDVYKKWFKGNDERGAYIRVMYDTQEEKPYDKHLVFHNLIYDISHVKTVKQLEKLWQLLKK